MFNTSIRATLILFLLTFLSINLRAQEDWDYIDQKDIVSSDTTKKGKYTLVLINKEQGFNEVVMQRLTDVFFKVYPREAKLYNKNTTDTVIFIIDPGYEGVAAASGRIVRFSPVWFKKNPGDVDVVTHEVMHLVQSYPGGAGPGWITEGIADYVRYTLGVDNEGANWSMPEYSSKHSYKDAYRITARFFYWIEKNGNKGLVKKLDNAMRTKTYTPDFWKENTGKSVDELWAAYASNPKLEKRKI